MLRDVSATRIPFNRHLIGSARPDLQISELGSERPGRFLADRLIKVPDLLRGERFRLDAVERRDQVAPWIRRAVGIGAGQDRAEPVLFLKAFQIGAREGLDVIGWE